MNNNNTYIYSLCLAIGLSALASGCIVIPVNLHSYGSRHNVNEEVMSTLQLGTTTKEYVFITFGEPDMVSVGGDCLTYKWEKVRLIWIIAGGAGGGGAILGGDMGHKYDLVLCFDDQGLLTRKDLKKKFFAE
jgi:hypothetical protein